MISAEPLGTLGSVDSLLEAFLYQGNHDRNHIGSVISFQLRDICSVPYAGAVRMLLHINGKFIKGKH
jgi:hypothetical protein